MYAAIPLGAFELHARIGQGAMGEVWRGRHVHQSLPVAVKLVLEERSFDDVYLRAFRHEVRQVARLDHPGVVMVFDHGAIDAATARASGGRLEPGTPYLVMELASGGSLESFTGRCLPWEQVRGMLLRLLDALAHAHARGVLHRDLKPGNVLLATQADQRPGLKLTDFGLAWATRDASAGVLELGGTPLYMAPEQIRGQLARQGPWTDLYAVGCVAWELLAGTPPLLGSSTREIFKAHCQDPAPPLPPDLLCPPRLDAWLGRLLAKDPQQRFACAADAAHALRALGAIRDEIDHTDATTHAPSQPSTSARTEPAGWLAHTLPDDALRSMPTAPAQPAPPSQAPPGQAAARPPAAPTPGDWRTPHREQPSMRLVGTGLGLYGLRQVPIVGRETQRDGLWSALLRAGQQARPQALVLHGRSGFGKTRLATWLAERAEELGAAQALLAWHSPQPGPDNGLAAMIAGAMGLRRVPLEQVPDRLFEALTEQGCDDPEEAGALLDWLDATLGGAGEIAPPPEAERRCLLRRMIARMSAQRPVVLVVDDAQWGAEALRFVHHLLTLPGAEPLPVLVVVTLGEEDLPERPVAAAAVQDLRALAQVQWIEVGPLDEAEQRELVDRLLFLEGELADAVRQRSGGNPTYAIELVGDWVHRAVLQPGERGFLLAAGEQPQLPDRVYQVWGARVGEALRDASPAGRLALQAAATLGLRVRQAEWWTLCDQLDLQPPHALVEALLARKLADPHADGWSFAHEMVRGSLEREAREQGAEGALHAACAAMLSARPPTPGRAERLGRHLVLAGRTEQALPHLLAGVEERLVGGAFREAEALLDRYASLLDSLGLPPEDARRGQEGVTRALVLVNQGAFDEVDRISAATAELARRHRWRAIEAPALRFRGMAAQKRGDFSLAEALLQQALSRAGRARDAREQAMAGMYLGVTYRQWGERDEAEQMLSQAREAFEALGERRLTADCHMELASLRLVLHDDPTGAEQAIQRAISGYQAAHSRAGVAYCRNTLAEIHRKRGALQVAEQSYQQAWRELERIGSHTRIFPLLNLGLVRLQQEHFALAEPVLLDVVEQALAGRRRAVESYAQVALAACAAHAQDWRGLAERLDRAEGLLDEAATVDPDLAWPAELAGRLAEPSAPALAARAREIAARQHEALGDTARAEELRATPRR